ncbi:MAG: fibronectin type III domain-containing protein, partial [Acidimicrobiia bacterium]
MPTATPPLAPCQTAATVTYGNGRYMFGGSNQFNYATYLYLTSMDGQRWVSIAGNYPFASGAVASDDFGTWIAPGTGSIIRYSDRFVGTISSTPEASFAAPTTDIGVWTATPTGVATDAWGNVYVADSGWGRVTKVSKTGSTIWNVNGFSSPQSLAVDTSGNVYVVGNHRVSKISTNGTVTTIAGTGTSGYSGDGGPATNAQLAAPYGVAVDSAGNVYIADTSNQRVRKISTNDGKITTIAGTGVSGHSGDGGTATNAQLSAPYGVAVDSAGNVYIADTGNDRVRKISTNGIITTIAGNGSRGYSGDGGPATNAQLGFLQSLAIDGTGNLYIATPNDVRKITVSGTIFPVTASGIGNVKSIGGVGTDPSGQVLITAKNGYGSVFRVQPWANDSLTLAWRPNSLAAESPATGYDIRYWPWSSSSGCANPTGATTVTSLSASTVSYAIPGLASNTALCAQVRAKDAAGDREWGPATLGTTLPGSPTVTGISRSGTNATFTWTAPSGNAPIRSYVISAFTDTQFLTAAVPGSTMQSAAECQGASATQSFTPTPVNGTFTATFPCLFDAAGTQQYAFRITAVNDAGLGASGGQVAVPSAPVGLRVTITTTSSLAFTFTNDPGSISVRRYEYSSDNKAFCTATSLLANNQPQVTISKTCANVDLASNTSYTFWVRAANDLGVGPAASITAATRPLAPTNLTQTGASSDGVPVSIASVAWSGAKSFSPAAYLYSAAYGKLDDDPLWVAAGQDFSYRGVIYTSPDRTTWTKRYTGKVGVGGSNILDVKFGGGTFVAVGYSDGGSLLLTSTNGNDWTPRTLTASAAWNSSFTDPANSCTQTGQMEQNNPQQLIPKRVVYTGSTWVIMATALVDSGPDNDSFCTSSITSSDASTWSVNPPQWGFFYSIAYGNGRIMAVGDGAIYSIDSGVTWKRSYGSFGWSAWPQIAFGNGRFVVTDTFNNAQYAVTQKPQSGCPPGSQVEYDWNPQYQEGTYCWNGQANWQQNNPAKFGPSGGNSGGFIFAAGRFVSVVSGKTFYSIDGLDWNSTDVAVDKDGKDNGLGPFTLYNSPYPRSFWGLATDGVNWIGTQGWNDTSRIAVGVNGAGMSASITAPSITVQFTAPSGTQALVYQYSTDGGTTFCDFATTDRAIPSSPGSTITVTAKLISNCDSTQLQQDATYALQVRAYNGSDGTNVSDATLSVIVLTNPSTPTATAGRKTATVTFTRYTSYIGMPSLDTNVSYATACISRDGGASGSASLAAPVTVTNLTPGKTYKCTVTASRSGTSFSPSSTPSSAFVVFDVPASIIDAPVATPLDKGVTVRWKTPADNGSAITSYSIAYSASNDINTATIPADAISANATVTVNGVTSRGAEVTGLNNGTTYNFWVRASNAGGPAEAWSPVATSTPRAPMKITVD